MRGDRIVGVVFSCSRTMFSSELVVEALHSQTSSVQDLIAVAISYELPVPAAKFSVA